MTTRWPLLLALLGLFFAVLTGWSVHRAASRGSEVSPDYHGHGLRPARSEGPAEVQPAWTTACVLQGGELSVQLSRADGSPVAGARGRLELPAAGGRAAISLPLAEAGEGRYVVQLASQPPGELSATLVFIRGRAVWTRPLALFL